MRVSRGNLVKRAGAWSIFSAEVFDDGFCLRLYWLNILVDF